MIPKNGQVLDRTRSLKKGVMAATLDVSLTDIIAIKHRNQELFKLCQHGIQFFFIKIFLVVQELLEKSRTKLGYEMDRQVGFRKLCLKIFAILFSCLQYWRRMAPRLRRMTTSRCWLSIQCSWKSFHTLCLQTLENNTTLMLLYAGERYEASTPELNIFSCYNL